MRVPTLSEANGPTVAPGPMCDCLTTANVTSAPSATTESTSRVDGPIRHPSPTRVAPSIKVRGRSTVSGPTSAPTST
jgi:hypothetical protein